MTENEIAKHVVDVAFKAHTSLGPGLLESVYERVMVHELQKRGLRVRRQQGIPVIYESIRMNMGFRADLIVEKLVVEIKSIEAIGLLINFNVDLIKYGITRVVNGLAD